MRHLLLALIVCVLLAAAAVAVWARLRWNDIDDN